MQASITRHGDGNGNGDRLELSGDLTINTARALFAQTPSFNREQVVIDLKSVGEADSSGLALLLHWANRAGASSGKLTFTNAPAQLRKLAKITGLEELLE